jgi:hypothetical protein
MKESVLHWIYKWLHNGSHIATNEVMTPDE